MGLVDRIISGHTVIPNDMVTSEHVRVVLENIEKILGGRLPGDAVEFGCYEGTTSLFIARLLRLYGTDKRFHVYDSFLGLPDKGPEDGDCQDYVKGSCQTTRSRFEANFAEAGVPLPEIHEGWFRDMSGESLPKKICFAFLDGDFYSSVMDSLVLVYPRMVTGARLIVHDYTYQFLPGVEKACADFLKWKPEAIVDSGCGGLGLLVKE